MLGPACSTRDVDQDERPGDSCAVESRGAWWYYNCFESNLNGLYYQGGDYKDVSTSSEVFQ